MLYKARSQVCFLETQEISSAQNLISLTNLKPSIVVKIKWGQIDYVIHFVEVLKNPELNNLIVSVYHTRGEKNKKQKKKTRL